MTSFVLSAALVTVSATPAHALKHNALRLDDQLESLYQIVSQKFASNPWYKNSANPDLYQTILSSRNLPPEFAMPSLPFFKTAMKSYCSLMQSNQSKRVGSPSRYSIVDYSQDAKVRRLYVYDVKNQEIIQNTWTAHGTNSVFGARITLGDVDLNGDSSGLNDVVLSYSDYTTSAFFSNVNESLQSSVGMAVTQDDTYWSDAFQCNALRMVGVDGAFNSKLFDRSIVIHAFDYSAGQIGSFGVPGSWGCVMLQRRGFFQGEYDAPIADRVISDMKGGPILLYHERMIPERNQSYYEAQMKLYHSLEEKLKSNFARLARRYGWGDEEAAKYLGQLTAKLKSDLKSQIDSTYEYFQNTSSYVGKEVNDQDDCMAMLGIDKR